MHNSKPSNLNIMAAKDSNLRIFYVTVKLMIRES